MIYFDNAATTKDKPEVVYEAFEYYVREIGVSPGRGSYQSAIDASRMLFSSRKTVGDYFGLEKKTNVVFTKNSTEAINLFFNGYLKDGDHVIISCYEHNAVLRPIHKMSEYGKIEYSIISRDDLDRDAAYILDKYAKKNTKVMALTLASNLTGRIIFNENLMQEAKRRKITTFLDSSQGAGKISINMSKMGIDYLAFTGHKDLLALPGVGGLCCKDKDSLIPLIQGGTGIFGDEYTNPNAFPEGLEAGTLNMPAIWSLKNSIDYLCTHSDQIKQIEEELTTYLLNRLTEIAGIHVYDEYINRVSTVGINIDGIASNELVQLLDQNGIAVRGGIHCAILAHEALGTEKQGVVRISLSFNNTKEEIDEFIEVLKRCR